MEQAKEQQNKIQRIKVLLKAINEEYELDLRPDDKKILEVESKLGLKFPEDYKQFLKTFGWIYIFELAGINSTLEETLKLRKSYGDEFPNNIIPIDEDGYGNYYCLVCSGKDKGKVIFWQHDLPPEKIYPNIPEGKDKDFWIEASDFWTWLIEQLQADYERSKDKEE